MSSHPGLPTSPVEPCPAPVTAQLQLGACGLVLGGEQTGGDVRSEPSVRDKAKRVFKGERGPLLVGGDRHAGLPAPVLFA